jgi:AraC-like DNA-binding protein
MTALKRTLESFIASQGGGDGVFLTPMDGVTIMRNSRTALPQHGQPLLYTPSLCVVVQGAKQMAVGDDVFDYGEDTALIVSVELPGVGRVTKASASEPFMSMTIEFDVAVMRDVMEKLELPPTPNEDRLSVFIERLSDQLRDCILRLAQLTAKQDAIAVLYPDIMRELCFWLLTGPNAGDMCKIALRESRTRRIADSIYFLRKNLMHQISIEDMAAAACMSASSFHQHFKTLTSLTPVRFQKELRLLEARKLMVVQSASVANAAQQVGYESVSQFSREYTRMFGLPPARDAEAVKARVRLVRGASAEHVER